MKFRVSIAGGNNNTSNNPFGGLGNVSVPSVAMNFVKIKIQFQVQWED